MILDVRNSIVPGFRVRVAMRCIASLFRFKTMIIIATAISFTSCTEANQQTSDTENADGPLAENVSVYDSALAKKLGADDYGMQTYVMAFLKRGPNRNQDSLEAAKLQRAHLDNIMRMAEEGKLLIAGPFMDDQEIRGIYIFDVRTVDEAKALTETDPAIRAGRLAMELHPWYGPAALPLLNDMHEKVTKKKI